MIALGVEEGAFTLGGGSVGGSVGTMTKMVQSVYYLVSSSVPVVCGSFLTDTQSCLSS